MKTELLTKKIRKVAQEIASLSGDIEHNKARKQFYTDLIKQRIFELYDLNKELASEGSALSEAEKEKHFLKQHTLGGMFRTEQDAAEKQKKEREQLNNIQETKPVSNSPQPENVPREEKPVEEKPVEEKRVEEEVISELVLEKEPEKEPVAEVQQREEVAQVQPIHKEENVSANNWLAALLEETVAKKLQSNDLTQRLQNTPVSNFYNTVSISQKHEFIDGLFAGKPDVYRSTLQRVEECGNLQASLSYLNAEISPAYHWEKKEKLVAEFLFLVRRRFL